VTGIRRVSLLAEAVACSVAVSSAGAATTTKPIPGFRSPTGNISCLFVPASHDDTGHPLQALLLCSIGKASYAARLRDGCLNPNGAKGAGVDWHGWSLNPTRKGSIVCSGGILYNSNKFTPSYVTLAYGKTMHHDGMTCTSRISGVTCSNSRDHGLFVSRRSWRVW
jgi:hypothetical protein